MELAIMSNLGYVWGYFVMQPGGRDWTYKLMFRVWPTPTPEPQPPQGFLESLCGVHQDFTDEHHIWTDVLVTCIGCKSNIIKQFQLIVVLITFWSNIIGWLCNYIIHSMLQPYVLWQGVRPMMCLCAALHTHSYTDVTAIRSYSGFGILSDVSIKGLPTLPPEQVMN